MTPRAFTTEGGRSDWFQAPSTLAEWEELIKTRSTSSEIGICVLDSNLRYLAINESLARMNGAPAQAHLGKSVRDMMGDFAELVEAQFQHVIRTGQAILNREVSAVLSTRSEPWHWNEHYIPIRDSKGRVAQVAAVMIETTPQKKLEESFRSVSEKLKAEKKQNQVVTEIGQLVSGKWQAQAMFPKISALLRRVLRQEYAALCLRDDETGELAHQIVDFPLGKRQGFPVGAPRDPRGEALQRGASLIFSKEEMKVASHDFLAEGLKSLCCVPLLRPTGPVGVLVLGSTRADAFRIDDLSLLNHVAAQLAIALENDSITREIDRLKSRFQLEKVYSEGQSRERPHFEGIVGESSALKKVLDQVAVVAESDVTVILLGETGTGKSLIARAIHALSKRKDKSFVTLNCAAIPTGLLESELFGHEKGAFTGAVQQKVGRLEIADKGTIFLDEVAEISQELQPKLLRVLQEQEFERLGGIRTIKVDLRLIAATNRDLVRSMVEGGFRSDLFYRLHVFPIRLPALRERREDIPLLVRAFVQKFGARMGRTIETIPQETMDALKDWSWPGNIRELENFIERSVILTEGTALYCPLAELKATSAGIATTSLENTEKEYIIRILRASSGIMSGANGAAARLGIKRTTLQSKMKRLGITRRDYCEIE